MKGVLIWALSEQPALRNCSTGEGAGYPQLDGKTPWSFTAGEYWKSVIHVQDRWETEKYGRQVVWSRPWDTSLGLLIF